MLTGVEEHCFSEMKINIIPLNEQSLMSALEPFMFVSGGNEDVGRTTLEIGSFFCVVLKIEDERKSGEILRVL